MEHRRGGPLPPESQRRRRVQKLLEAMHSPPIGNSLLRDLLIAMGACLLWFALVAVGAYVTLRYTSAGQLMIDLEGARQGRGHLERVLAGYEDPWTLLVETVPRLLWIVGATATVAAGIFVGALASGRSSWPPALTAAVVASLLGFIEFTSAANWLRAGAVAIMLCTSGLLVMRWRRGRRRAG